MKAMRLFFCSCLVISALLSNKLTASDIRRLKQQLNSSNWQVRRDAAEQLHAVGKPVKDVLPLLVAALDDDHRSVRVAAIKSLGRIGAAAEDGVPALRKAMNDPSTRVYAAGATGLPRPKC